MSTTDALRRLAKNHGGYRAVAAKAGVNDQTIYQIVTGKLLPSGKPRQVGRTMHTKLTAAFPGWDDPPIEGESTLETLDAFTVPPLMTWEEMMDQQTLPAAFRLAVPDDALAPQYERGMQLIMSSITRPDPGDVVLVQSGTGARYLRTYSDRGGGRWAAVAPNPHYPDLDSQADALQLLGVLDWVRPKRG